MFTGDRIFLALLTLKVGQTQIQQGLTAVGKNTSIQERVFSAWEQLRFRRRQDIQEVVKRMSERTVYKIKGKEAEENTEIGASTISLPFDQAVDVNFKPLICNKTDPQMSSDNTSFL